MSEKRMRRLAATGLAWVVLAVTAWAGEKPAVDEAVFKKVRAAKTGEMAGEFNQIAALAVASFDDAELRKALEKQLVDLVGAADATFDARQFACRQLMLMGTAASVPALAKLLPDEALSHMGRYALERMPCPEAAKALRDALSVVKGKLLVGVVNSIGQRRDAEAAAALIPLLKDADKDVAEAAARALGKIGGDEALKALKAARADAKDRLLQITNDAVLRCADLYLAAGEKAKAKAIYEAMHAPAEAKHIRAAALRGLVATGGDEAIALILKSLAGDDAAMQAVAVGFIRDVPGAEATKAVAAQLGKMPPAVQTLVIEALAARGDAAAAPAVVEATKAQDDKVRVAALQALASLGDAAAVPLLVKAAAGEAKPEADAARNTLTLLKGKGVDEAVLAEMKQADPKGKAELIKTLAARRAEAAVPELLKAAEDPDEGVRREAFTAIGKLATEKTMPDLVALLVKAKGDESLKAAERAVLTVAREIPDAQAATAPLIAALPNATPAGKTAILRILGKFGGDKPLAAVRAALDDKDATVQDAALRTLADWPDASPADDLLKLVRAAKSDVHRVLALRGYIRMLALPCDVPIGEILKRYDETMKLAASVQDKKQVLAGMAELRHPAVLKALQPYLADAALKAEAEAAIKKVQEAMKAPSKVTASVGAEKAGNAVDGKPDTRWDSAGPQSGGEWFMVELPVEQIVTKVILDATGSGGDYPRGYEVYISRDGKAWGPPAAKGEGKQAVVTVELKPAYGRFVKIVQTGKADGLFWSIHELKLETKPTE